jgi:hypothetical protein
MTGRNSEAILLLAGKEFAWRVAQAPPNTDLQRVGFRVFSQHDEDGIVQYLINNVPIENKTFIEFGVENYEESNTRFLLVNDSWQGMVLDASVEDIRYIQGDRVYWQYDLQAYQRWITAGNIDSLLGESGFSEDLGLLSIDIDGNDYWIWKAITSVRPRIVIVEYNSVFGLEPISVPYREDFNRTRAHFSNLYYGCSLGALQSLAEEKGYILVGSNAWGHNAFFIRSDIAGDFTALKAHEVYVPSKFRESRDAAGKLTYVRGNDRIQLIGHLPVVDVITGKEVLLRELYPAT